MDSPDSNSSVKKVIIFLHLKIGKNQLLQKNTWLNGVTETIEN